MAIGSSDRSIAWSASVSTTVPYSISAVALDARGDVVVGGSTTGDLGGGGSAGQDDAWVAKLTGTLIWQKRYGSAPLEDVLGTAVGPAGDLYLAGSSALGAAPEDIYLARASGADGSAASVEAFGTPARDVADGIALDFAGNPVVTGYTEGDLVGDGRTPGIDMFVAKHVK